MRLHKTGFNSGCENLHTCRSTIACRYLQMYCRMSFASLAASCATLHVTIMF